MPGRLFIPQQVLQAIRAHVETAVRHAESGYTSAQEEEDTITGELGGALRTNAEQIVEVTDAQVLGTWRWGITYSKFRSKAKGATESIVGADGILEIRVGTPEQAQQKAALFQAKNTLKYDPKLVEQCAKMSVWREASFVISYAAEGYKAYSLDDILLARGSIAQANNGIPLASWIVDTFIGCRIGHPDLFYDKKERKLYWLREPSSEGERGVDRRVWVDFSPKHLIHIDVTPPDWRWSGAVEFPQDKISLGRLAYTPKELFGLEAPFTMSQLKKRRAELLRAYHSDKSYHLSSDLRSRLDARVIEIIEAFSILSKDAEVREKIPKTQKENKAKSPSGLGEARTPTVDESLGKSKKGERVKHKKRD